MNHLRLIVMSIATAASFVYANREGHRADGLLPPAAVMPNCVNPDVFTQQFSSIWVKRTVSDTGVYARTMRAEAGILQTSPDSVSLVTDEAVCGPLMQKFARVVAGRDTLASRPVLVVRIGPSKYLVSDLKLEGTSFPGVVAQTQWSQFATMTFALDSVRIWRYRHLDEAAPYPWQQIVPGARVTGTHFTLLRRS